MADSNYMASVLADLKKAQDAARKPYIPKEGEGYIKNDTYTTMKQKHIPEGNYEFRIMPRVDGKNPGMYLVQKHAFLKSTSERQGERGAYDANQYDYVLGSVTNPEMTYLDPIIVYWKEFEKRKRAEFEAFPSFLKLALKDLRGTTYFDVPVLIKAEHEADTFMIGDKEITTWHLTKPSKTNILGKIFQMQNADIFGRQGPPDEDGVRSWDGVFGILNDFRNPETGETADSLGKTGQWLTLMVTRTKGTWPVFGVKSTGKMGALSQELIDKYMHEDNYPDLYQHNKFFKKDNATVANMFRESMLYKELNTRTGWKAP